MGTPPGRLQLISSQTLGAHVPRRLVALLDTIACEDHISRGQVNVSIIPGTPVAQAPAGSLPHVVKPRILNVDFDVPAPGL